MKKKGWSISSNFITKKIFSFGPKRNINLLRGNSVKRIGKKTSTSKNEYLLKTFYIQIIF